MSLGVHMLVDDPLKVLIVAGKGRQKPNHKTAVICAGHNSESPHHTQRERAIMVIIISFPSTRGAAEATLTPKKYLELNVTTQYTTFRPVDIVE